MKTSAPLRILIVSDHTYLPDRSGGRESSIHDLAVRLTQLGNSVTVVANRGPLRDYPKVILKRATWRQCYRILRVKNEKEASIKIIKKNQCDVSIYNVLRAADYAALSENLSRRQIFYIRDAEDVSLGQFESSQPCGFVANSQFIAQIIEKRTGKKPFVFPPFIELSQYKCLTTREHVTFINPVPAKGVDTAIAIAAACKEFNFLFIEGWPLTKNQRSDLEIEIRRHKNIRLIASISDKRRIYSSTKVLLVPSKCEEAFGRVVLEAQVSGIPVLATDIGGLPESVGVGGILIPPKAGLDAWLRPLKLLENSPDYYSALSELAKKNAKNFYQSNQDKILEFESWLTDFAHKAR